MLAPVTIQTQALTVRGLLVMPGWDDDGRRKFEVLQSALQPAGWICQRGHVPDHSWPAAKRKAVSREDALQQALKDHYALQTQLNGGPIALAGFSFGAYIGAYLAAARPIHYLAMRSPALYPNEDWDTPKEELDKRDLAEYRRRFHKPWQNGALLACARFQGDVLLVDSSHDRIIPPPVIASYEAAFQNARSLTRYTLKGADHTLSEPRWQAEYRDILLGWLNDHRARIGQGDQASA